MRPGRDAPSELLLRCPHLWFIGFAVAALSLSERLSMDNLPFVILVLYNHSFTEAAVKSSNSTQIRIFKD